MIPDSDYRIKLQAFEGPLDLLLFLIRKSEIAIYDIPIDSVTRQALPFSSISANRKRHHTAMNTTRALAAKPASLSRHYTVFKVF